MVKSQICRKQLGHAIFETQKDRDLALVKRVLATVEILLPRLNQQSQYSGNILAKERRMSASQRVQAWRKHMREEGKEPMTLSGSFGEIFGGKPVCAFL